MASYPWSGYSADTLNRQREINIQAVLSGRCPPLVEDGILGPKTCGAAAAYASQLPAVAEMTTKCTSFTTSAATGCSPIPWNTKANGALSLQIGLNMKLPGLGFGKLVEDGVLGPNTCAGAAAVLGEATAIGLGCKSFGSLIKTGSAASPDTPTQVPTTTYPPVVTTPPPVTTAPPITSAPPVTSTPHTSPVTASAAPSKNKWLLWSALAVGGLLGGYYLLRGDQTKTVLTTTKR